MRIHVASAIENHRGSQTIDRLPSDRQILGYLSASRGGKYGVQVLRLGDVGEVDVISSINGQADGDTLRISVKGSGAGRRQIGSGSTARRDLYHRVVVPGIVGIGSELDGGGQIPCTVHRQRLHLSAHAAPVEAPGGAACAAVEFDDGGAIQPSRKQIVITINGQALGVGRKAERRMGGQNRRSEGDHRPRADSVH